MLTAAADPVPPRNARVEHMRMYRGIRTAKLAVEAVLGY